MILANSTKRKNMKAKIYSWNSLTGGLTPHPVLCN